MIEEEAFKDWGCANTIDWSGDKKLQQAFSEARHMHFNACKNHPDIHKVQVRELGKCYREYSCTSCKFRFTEDSSD